MIRLIVNISILVLALIATNATAQFNESFDSFTLTPNSYYQSSTGADWQTSILSPFVFRYGSDGVNWTSGSAYTNVKDTANGTISNLYGCSTYTAFDGGNYVTAKDSAIIKLKRDTMYLSGFFVTNTTFAWKTMKNGSAVSRKLGDTTGTGSGTSIAQGAYPDWFKLVVVGFKHGVRLDDSIEFYLADYRLNGTANDYIIKSWRYVNCTSMGFVDSVMLNLRSSGMGVNVPGYVSFDRISTVNAVGIHEQEQLTNISVSPNPASKQLALTYSSQKEEPLNITIFDISGKEMMRAKQPSRVGRNNTLIEIEMLDAGLYFITISDGRRIKTLKFIKL